MKKKTKITQSITMINKSFISKEEEKVSDQYIKIHSVFQENNPERNRYLQ